MRLCGVAIVFWLATAGPVSAGDLRFAGIFTDHAVLQRDRPVPIWGWADPAAEVTVSFAGQKQAATADASGRWQVQLEPLAASAEPRRAQSRARQQIGRS